MTGLRCADVEARFIDVLDGRLDPADTVRFHAHIEGCAACRERAALWRALTPKLRDAVPPAPEAMSTRRMQVEIERRLAVEAAASPARRWRPWLVPTFGFAAAAAAVVVLVARVVGPAQAPHASIVGYAAITGVRGDARIGDQPSRVAARVPVGAPIALAAGASVELTLDGGAAVHVDGPGRLALEGSARDVAIRLYEGKLAAAVTHRQPNEAFAVVTEQMRVAVRGTKFSVTAHPGQSRVDVTEGQVAVAFTDGRNQLVSAGDVAEWPAPPVAPVEQPTSPDQAVFLGCWEIYRSCQGTASAVRTSMRGGDFERARRQLVEGQRLVSNNSPDTECDRIAGLNTCADELRYLNAEVLNQSGRLDDAVTAYRALDRRSATSAMRQNALYAAAQIERRQGHPKAAASDFERASAVAPRGALHEDALAGAMQSASDAGDKTRARELAARYLREYPRGLTAPAARKLAGDGAP